MYSKFAGKGSVNKNQTLFSVYLLTLVMNNPKMIKKLIIKKLKLRK